MEEKIESFFKIILNEIKGDRDIENKKIALKKAKAKSKVHCIGDLTPQLSRSSTKENPIYVCRPKDKGKAKVIRKIIRIMKTKEPQKFKKKYKKAVDTKKFRYNK